MTTDATITVGAYLGCLLLWALLAWVLTRDTGGPTTWD